MKHIIPFAVSIFLIQSLRAQNISVDTYLDQDTIVIGKQVKLRYQITKNTNDIIVFQPYSDSITGQIEVLGQPKLDSVRLKNDKEQIIQTFTITSFEMGLQIIPPRPFINMTPLGADTFYSPSKYMLVAGTAIDTTGEIRDIKGIENVKLTFQDLKPFLFLIGIVLLVCSGLFFLLKYLKRKKFEQINTSVEPAHLIALRELDKLKAQKLWQQKRLKEYYSRLSGIIRTYIENKYDILAMEKATSEILLAIQLRSIDKFLPMDELTSLLNLSDLVKFAKGEANPEENILHLENAYNFIKISSQHAYDTKAPVIINSSSEFMNFISEGIDLAIKSLKDSPGPLIPFAFVYSEGQKTNQKFNAENYQESIKKAEKYIAEFKPIPDYAIYVFDGLFTMNNKKTDAVYIKAFNKDETKGLVFVQRYMPKTRNSEFQRIEIPILTGKVDTILSSKKKNYNKI